MNMHVAGNGGSSFGGADGHNWFSAFTRNAPKPPTMPSPEPGKDQPAPWEQSEPKATAKSAAVKATHAKKKAVEPAKPKPAPKKKQLAKKSRKPAAQKMKKWTKKPVKKPARKKARR